MNGRYELNVAPSVAWEIYKPTCQPIGRTTVRSTVLQIEGLELGPEIVGSADPGSPSVTLLKPEVRH